MATTREQTVEKIKVFIRVSHAVLDSEISDEIDECLLDLATTAGVQRPDETDPLIRNALKLWCKAHFQDDPDEGAKFMERYNALKASLTMASGYGGAGGDTLC